MIAIKPGCDDLVPPRIRQQIPRQLFGQKPIVWLVGIERINHPIPPSPHHPLAVALIALRIGIPRRVQPANRHPLAKPWRLQQPVHNPLIGLR